MGVSPWKTNQTGTIVPKGRQVTSRKQFMSSLQLTQLRAQPVAPSGLSLRVGSRDHGLTPVATTCRPFRGFPNYAGFAFVFAEPKRAHAGNAFGVIWYL